MNGADAACDPVGTTGEWNAASGRSSGWENWSIDLSAYAGSQVEVSISYVSDWGVQGIGSFVDDITVSTEGSTESFESDLGVWTVAGPAPGSQINANDWTRTTDVGYEEGAVVAMAPTDADFRTVYFGFGFEGVTSADQRNASDGTCDRLPACSLELHSDGRSAERDQDELQAEVRPGRAGQAARRPKRCSGEACPCPRPAPGGGPPQ